MCGSSDHGLAHVLAVCSGTQEARQVFMATVDRGWHAELQHALPGDWPTAVLSPHQGVERLLAAVKYGAGVVKKLSEVAWAS